MVEAPDDWGENYARLAMSVPESDDSIVVPYGGSRSPLSIIPMIVGASTAEYRLAYLAPALVRPQGAVRVSTVFRKATEKYMQWTYRLFLQLVFAIAIVECVATWRFRALGV
jgi:hypothetical protein